jgi:ribosome-associated protein
MEVLRDAVGRPAPVNVSVRERITLDEVRDWCGIAARAAWSKGGEDTVVLSVGQILAITDAFVITSGTNPRQVRSMAEEVELRIKEAGGPAPIRIEGLDDARWVLMDFGDFVVHAMLGEAREFYQLERLWSDAEPWEWRDGEARAAGG